mgnify:FL=1
MEEDARKKLHSTTAEAVQVAADMGAHRTVLTHFSQRYPHVPPIPASCRHNTVIAFDMMTVNLADLDKVPLMVECNAP